MQYPALFLKNRLDDLYIEASRSQGSWEASKLLCLGGSIVAGVAAATNPLMMLFSVGASCAYVWAIVKEGTRSSRFKPLPIFTSSIGDLLGGAAGGNDDESEPMSAEIKYLTPQETTEVLLLDFQIQSVARFLSSIEESEREQAYKQLVKYFHHQYGAIAQHQPSLLFNSDSELQEAFDSALSFPAFEPDAEAELSPRSNSAPVLENCPSEGDFSVSQSFAAALRSMFILGCPGVGKGVIVSIAWREVKKRFPDLIIYVIDPKNSDREKGYWEGVDYHDGLKVESLLISRHDKAKWLRDRLIEFDSLPSPKLLIVDELVALSKNLGNYPESKEAYTMLTDYAVSIVSSAQSEGRFVWLITQSPNLTTLKIDGGDATIFPGVLLYRDGVDNEAWLKSTARCTLGSAVTIDPEEISRVAAASPRRTIAFDTRQKKWQAVPNLTNHSGFNRDEYLKTLKKTDKKITSENLVQPLAPATVSEDLLEADLPTPEQAIGDRLKELGIRKTERRGIAIFKVWKWAKDRTEPISLTDAVERFRKDRGKQITRAEIHWSLEKLQLLDLVKYLDSEQKSGTLSERTEQAL